MVTKDQERQALKRIKEIVDELGPDSYIGMAFDGVFELAKENIDNDFGYSCMAYINETVKLRDQLRKAENELEEKGRMIGVQVKELARQESIISDKEAEIEKLETDIEIIRNKRLEVARELVAEQDAHDIAKREVVKLKAKLFDLLYAE